MGEALLNDEKINFKFVRKNVSNKILCNAPCLDDFHIEKIRIWKENDEVVSIVRPLSPWLGEAVIDNRCLSNEILHDIIQYSEENFSVANENNKQDIFLLLCDLNDKLDHIVIKKGIRKGIY